MYFRNMKKYFIKLNYYDDSFSRTLTGLKEGMKVQPWDLHTN